MPASPPTSVDRRACVPFEGRREGGAHDIAEPCSGRARGGFRGQSSATAVPSSFGARLASTSVCGAPAERSRPTASGTSATLLSVALTSNHGARADQTY